MSIISKSIEHLFVIEMKKLKVLHEKYAFQYVNTQA